jgi:catechol 2,3-dioxygenase-like lactoylglutathione lyase family enzyme
MAKVTGLGGLFYKVADPARTRAWYEEMLGISGEFGAMFCFKDDDRDGYAILSPFGSNSDYFEPSQLPFMVNLRVDDLDGMIASLEAKGVEVIGRQDEDYGRFAWITDLDGLKVELWQQLGPSPSPEAEAGD